MLRNTLKGDLALIPPSSSSGSITDPNVAHFLVTGSGGDGSPSNPYGPGDWQASLDTGFRNFDIGPGVTAGDATLTGHGDIVLNIFGRGITGNIAQVGTLYNADAGASITAYVFGNLQIAGLQVSNADSNGGNLSVYGSSEGAVFINTLESDGGNSSSGDGFSAGNILISNVTVNILNRNGSDAFGGGGGNGGNTGNLSLYGTATVITDNNTPGIGDGGGSAGTLGTNIRYLSNGISISSIDNTTRTILLQPIGNAIINLPSGTSTTFQVDSGWGTNTTSGDKTAVLAAYTAGLNGTMIAALNVVSAGTGTAIANDEATIALLVKQVAALKVMLLAKKYPNT